MLIFKAVNEVAQRLPEGVNVLGGAWQIVLKLNLRLLHGPQLMHRELEAPVKFIDQSADFNEIVLFKDIDVVGYVVPHLGINVSGPVSQRQGKIKVAALFWLGLFGDHYERRGYHLVFVEVAIADVELFHGKYLCILAAIGV